MGKLLLARAAAGSRQGPRCLPGRRHRRNRPGRCRRAVWGRPQQARLCWQPQGSSVALVSIAPRFLLAFVPSEAFEWRSLHPDRVFRGGSSPALPSQGAQSMAGQRGAVVVWKVLPRFTKGSALGSPYGELAKHPKGQPTRSCPGFAPVARAHRLADTRGRASVGRGHPDCCALPFNLQSPSRG